MLALKPCFRLDVDLGPAIDVGPAPSGHRHVIPITGGIFEGERVRGTIVPGGADWNLVRPDGVVHLYARYTLQTDDGVYISILNEGFQRGPADTMARILSGQPIETSEWYSRTSPRFEISGPHYRWMNETVFIGDLFAPDRADRVSIQIYEVF